MRRRCYGASALGLPTSHQQVTIRLHHASSSQASRSLPFCQYLKPVQAQDTACCPQSISQNHDSVPAAVPITFRICKMAAVTAHACSEHSCTMLLRGGSALTSCNCVLTADRQAVTPRAERRKTHVCSASSRCWQHVEELLRESGYYLCSATGLQTVTGRLRAGLCWQQTVCHTSKLSMCDTIANSANL